MTSDIFEALKLRLHSGQTGVRMAGITDREIEDLTLDQAMELGVLYGGGTLMLLPKWERDFFDWLKVSDPSVWDDLWADEDQPYTVGFGQLPDLLPARRGFLISDLTTRPNACFGIDNIVGENGATFLDAALTIVRGQGRLRIDQAFIVEVYRAPIDQWRFAYMYNQPLESVKTMVGLLILDGILGYPATPEQEAGEVTEDHS